MIGVSANSSDLVIAAEFFQLFKTPWEPAVPGRTYQAVLSTEGRIEHLDARAFLMYGSTEHEPDRRARVAVERVQGPMAVEWEGSGFPLYGDAAVFDTLVDVPAVTWEQKPLVYRSGPSDAPGWRIGYHLFSELRHLLGAGQPVHYAEIPTLELHIALLRFLLLESGVHFVEVPPRPYGYEFTCCLTHDLDFVGIRRHAFDRTLAGFVARGSLGTAVDVLRGRRPVTDALRNWAALCSLPFVLLGFAPDFWRPFDDYSRMEEGLPSTFFVIPFRGRPGEAPDKTVDAARAVAYQMSDIREELTGAVNRGCEIAVHGIDAWRDADTGREEIAELAKVTGQKTAGVRMHWLYFAADSPRQLEDAGFDYDSTCGYNDAIGYRAGTSQAFRLPGTQQLLELPLTIMDSALFYRGRMALSRDEALRRCGGIMANARRFGGTVVINWHDRSLAPERLWGSAYAALLADLRKGERAWFATAAHAVEWFRWRRSVTFTTDAAGQIAVTASPQGSTMPGGSLLIQRPASHDPQIDEIAFRGDATVRIKL